MYLHIYKKQRNNTFLNLYKFCNRKFNSKEKHYKRNVTIYVKIKYKKAYFMVSALGIQVGTFRAQPVTSSEMR